MPPAALVRIKRAHAQPGPGRAPANVTRAGVVPFVDVAPAREHGHAPPARRAHDEPSGVADDAGHGPVREVGVRHRSSRRRAARRSRRGPSPGRRRCRADRGPARGRRQRRRSPARILPRRSLGQGGRAGARRGGGHSRNPAMVGGHEVGQRPGDHRAQAEARQVVAAFRRERADAADLDADRAEVRESAQREGRDRERPRIERCP